MKKTMDILADELGISRAALYKHKNKPGAPKNKKTSAWIEFLDREHHATGQGVEYPEKGPLHERLDKAKLANLLLDGQRKQRLALISERKLIPKEDVLFFATVFGDIINTAIDAIAIKARVNDAVRIELKKLCDDAKHDIDEGSRREFERLTAVTDQAIVQPE